MKARFPGKGILHSYARHPLRAETILARIKLARGSLINLTEDDLAYDAADEITDQNHVGGAEFVLELGRLAEVDEKTRVLDLGCGLGGAARVLAHTYGCPVTGIDISPERYRDALQLTGLTGLKKWVSHSCADIRNVSAPPGAYDVILGQAAWSHILEKGRFIAQWSQALRSSGRVAFEDVCLSTRQPQTNAAKILARLQYRWNCRLVRQEQWIDYLASAGIGEPITEDKTEEMIRYFEKLAKRLRHQSAAEPEETAAWGEAVQLAEGGFIKYVRLVARKARV